MFIRSAQMTLRSVANVAHTKSVAAPNLGSRVRSFVTTVTSGKVDEETCRQRLAICQGCGYLKRDGDHLYCGAYGCPQWPMSELHRKLRFASLRCPKGKCGPVADLA